MKTPNDVIVIDKAEEAEEMEERAEAPDAPTSIGTCKAKEIQRLPRQRLVKSIK